MDTAGTQVEGRQGISEQCLGPPKQESSLLLAGWRRRKPESFLSLRGFGVVAGYLIAWPSGCNLPKSSSLKEGMVSHLLVGGAWGSPWIDQSPIYASGGRIE